MASIDLEHLCVDLDRQRVLHDLNVHIDDGAFVAVVGPSGSGKSTLLRAIAGLVRSSHGTVSFGGVDISRLSAPERDIGMVFQESALLPRRNVRKNVEFPLEIRRATAEAIRDRVNAEVRSLKIEHLLERDPFQLSRGEQQLVQIARTMVRVPKVLLLDEPFAPLDAHLRSRMRAEISLLQKGYGVTTLMATNDPDDAVALASDVVVLGDQPATVVQSGPPSFVFDDPVSIDTATAMGPLASISTSVRSDGDGFWLERDGAARVRMWPPALRAHLGRDVTLAVRPGALTRDARGDAEVEIVRSVAGSPGTLVCRWGGRMTMASGVAEPGEYGTTHRFRVAQPLVFDPDTGARIR
ncbi:MAG: ABC transporter ATP-binding protein [Ilumatobacter sp.]